MRYYSLLPDLFLASADVLYLGDTGYHFQYITPAFLTHHLTFPSGGAGAEFHDITIPRGAAGPGTDRAAGGASDRAGGHCGPPAAGPTEEGGEGRHQTQTGAGHDGGAEAAGERVR